MSKSYIIPLWVSSGRCFLSIRGKRRRCGRNARSLSGGKKNTSWAWARRTRRISGVSQSDGSHLGSRWSSSRYKTIETGSFDKCVAKSIPKCNICPCYYEWFPR